MIDVLPSSVGTDGYLELLLATSYHPEIGGRPAEVYTISYRFGGPGEPGTRTTNGTQGIVNVPVKPGQWNTATLTPTDDIAALWPDLQAHDFASFGITLSAVSTGSRASGYFDYLRFARRHNTGQVPMHTQEQLIRAYRRDYPGVTQYQGLEISGWLPHVNRLATMSSWATIRA